MNINRQNYESILVDYLDGKLSPEDEAELMLFLLKNPDIAEEFEGLNDASINPTKIQYPNKSVLKKQSVQPYGINNEVDYLCIAELEGDINQKEKEQLARLIENDESIRHVQTVLTNTKLNVPHEIVYPYKSSLKRLQVIPIRRTTYRIAMSIAATVTIMFAVYTTIDRNLTSNIVAESRNLNPTTTQNVNTEPKAEVNAEHIAIETQNNTPRTQKNYSKKTTEPTKGKEWVREDIVIEKLQPLSANINQIAQAEPLKLNFSQPISTKETLAESTIHEKNQPIGSAKEYTLADLAEIGIKRVANTFGIEYNIQKNDKGKVEKLSIESSLLAFSTTRGKKDE